MKQDMNKERMYELAFKRGVKVDPKAVGILKKIHDKRDAILEKENKEIADKDHRYKILTTNARDLLNARRVEHGIG